MESKQPDKSNDNHLNDSHPLDFPGKRTVSRREFLKLAGVAGLAVSAGATLGGLFSGCGGTTTTTAAGGGTESTA
ncbi:MAG: hypothetical protein H5T84_01180, partial [Thermoleophilia bacterium]|nr:hypothetical protein [Thermoleophilia bacterium]